MGMFRENGDVKGSVYSGCVKEVTKLRAEIERLNDANDALIEIGHKQAAEIERWKEMSEHWKDECMSTIDDNTRLRAALNKYGRHLPDCTEVPLFCDCGLLKVKQAALGGE